MHHLTRSQVRAVLWRWGPPLAVMALLFVTSAQPKYGPPDPDATVYFSGLIPIFAGLLDVVVKKGAHFLVYGLLGLLLMRALVAEGMDARRASYLAIALAAGYALTDEFHQAFVPGRTVSGIDIGLDLAGAAAFTLIARRSRYPRSAI